MMPLIVRAVNTGGAGSASEEPNDLDRQRRSLLVCPIAGATEASSADTLQAPPEADVTAASSFEILPGHQPLCAVLPQGARVYEIFSADPLPRRESRTECHRTTMPAGGVLHVRSTPDATIVRIVLFGE